MSAPFARTCGNGRNGDDFWGNIELAAFATTLLVMAIIVPTKPIHFVTGDHTVFPAVLVPWPLF
jgi:hypothetical protein